MITIRRMIRGVVSPVMDVVLPEGCWAGGDDATARWGLSIRVREEIGALAAQRYCFHCGLTVGPFETHDAANPCGRCGQRVVGVARIARAGTFREPLITLVHRLKFGRSWEIAGVLAPFVRQAMAGVCQATHTPVDLLIPVPLHWMRRAARGFNQAHELARGLGALGGWPVADVLRRRRSTREQARIESPWQRVENLRGAFACRRNAGKHVAGRHVWLIDDVTTSGATLHAAASALRRLPRSQRPASINAAVVCVADHAAPPARVPEA